MRQQRVLLPSICALGLLICGLPATFAHAQGRSQQNLRLETTVTSQKILELQRFLIATSKSPTTLDADGIAGPMTLAVLARRLPSGSAEKTSVAGNSRVVTVAELQAFMASGQEK